MNKWVILLCLIHVCACAPLSKNDSSPHGKFVKKKLEDALDADPEYVRYLEELMKDLNDNPELRKEFNNVSNEDIKKGFLGDKLARMSNEVRSQLEEAKRKSVEQLRVLQKLKNLQGTKFNKKEAEIQKLESEFGIKLPAHFDDKDVEKLMAERKKDLDELDKKRHENFKHHEMQLAHQRKEKLRQMDEKARLDAEEKFNKEREEVKDHEKLHHPGSRDQMEEVWEKEDGLEKDQFEPRTFFRIHDTNGDQMLDALELEAMFLVEVRKIYGENSDPTELYEEMSRMREHVMKEIDRNGDGLLSMNEFLGYTEEDEWKNDDDGWDGIVDENEPFTDEEFKEWESEYYDYADWDNPDGEDHHEDNGDEHQRGEVEHQQANEEHQQANEEHQQEQDTPAPPHHEAETQDATAPSDEHTASPSHREEKSQDEPSQEAAQHNEEAKVEEVHHNPDQPAPDHNAQTL